MARQQKHDEGGGQDGLLPFFPLALAVIGVLNLVEAAHRFHLVMGIGCCAAAASLVLGFWRRSPARSFDAARAPFAALLFVWAVGLYGYVILSAAGNAFDRVTAGLLGSLYVFVLADRVLSLPHRFAGHEPGAG